MMNRYEVLTDECTLAKTGATINEDDIDDAINIDALVAGGHLKRLTVTPPKKVSTSESEAS